MLLLLSFVVDNVLQKFLAQLFSLNVFACLCVCFDDQLLQSGRRPSTTRRWTWARSIPCAAWRLGSPSPSSAGTKMVTWWESCAPPLFVVNSEPWRHLVVDTSF